MWAGPLSLLVLLLSSPGLRFCFGENLYEDSELHRRNFLTEDSFFHWL